MQPLVWLTLLLNGKFLIKELAFGQFNLPLALLLIGAVIAAQRQRPALAGLFVGIGVFVKPYALVLLPWLVWTQGWPALAAFGGVVAGGLALPASVYGWNGNLALLHEWYRTVTDTTAPNLLVGENISFATMWSKWLGPGAAASALAAATASAALGLGGLVLLKRRRVPAPDYLDCAFFFVLIPLLSPQGWDYVLLLALPAYMCLVDRWSDSSAAWRAVAMAGFVLTSFTIYDLLRRDLYFHLLALSGESVGAILLAVCVARLRWRALA
jgi:Glycosyltransferase family 87